MKKITFLLLSLTTFSVFAQDKLTSASEEFFDGSNWRESSRTEYVYDSKGNLITEKYLSDNNADGNLEVLESTTYTYNSSNRVVEENYGDSRNVFSYINNLPTQVISYELEGSNWVEESKIDLSYKEGKLDAFISFGWNGQEWILEDEHSERAKYIYTNSNLTTITYEDYENGSWSGGGKDEYTYDSNDRLIKEEFFSSNDDGSFSKEEFYDYSYDANNNIINQTGGFSIEGTTVNFEPETYQYDKTVLMSNIVNPFKEKYGIKIFTDTSDYFVNKILSKSTEDSRTIYNYNEATASINEFNSFVFNTYPNPTTSKLTIDDANISLKNIEIYNLLGKKIMSSTSNTIQLENIVNGIYIVKVNTTDGKMATKRIVKN